MRTVIRIWLSLYGGLLLFAFATGDVVYEDYADLAILASFLAPVAFGSFALWGLVFRRTASGLDRVIYRWSTGDPFTLRDLMRSCLCFGAIGSGKTSGFGYAMAMAILRAGCGVIVFGSKPEERGDWERYAKKAGRSADFRVFSEDSEECCNILECDIAAGLDTAGVVDNIQTIGQTLTRSKSRGEGAQFWELSETSELWFSVEPLRLATGKVRAKELRVFMAHAPSSPACLKRTEGQDELYESYQKGYHKAVMERARAAPKTDVQKHDFANCEIFWNKTYANGDPKTRSNIEAGLLATLDVFMRGIVHQKLCTTTTISAKDLENGAIWYVDFSPAAKGASGKFICAALKRHVQNHCLRREFKSGDRPIILWADECQEILNDFDARYIDMCRSHGSGMCFLTQSLSNVHMTMGKKEEAEALVGQFGHTIANAVDPITADYLVKRCGDIKRTKIGGGWSPSNDIDQRMKGNGQWSSNYSEEQGSARLNSEFMTGHKTGRGSVTAWVIRTGEEFLSNRLNHIFCTFKQEKR